MQSFKENMRFADVIKRHFIDYIRKYAKFQAIYAYRGETCMGKLWYNYLKEIIGGRMLDIWKMHGIFRITRRNDSGSNARIFGGEYI